MKKLANVFFATGARRAKSSAGSYARKPRSLRLESLENRELLTATQWTVDSVLDVVDPDDGYTTLREAAMNS
ncbi:MAG: hypothetical protein HUK22_06240, partial [Thermoguttaceae bacterium]|nr:hypothetical protein [Thermoguttaceae bacterium]